MFTDLRMFQLAKVIKKLNRDQIVTSSLFQEFVESTNPHEHKQLVAKQAKWAENTNEPKEAAKMFLSVGEYEKALEIIAQHNWSDM